MEGFEKIGEYKTTVDVYRALDGSGHIAFDRDRVLRQDTVDPQTLERMQRRTEPTIVKHQREMLEFLKEQGYAVELAREVWEEPRPSGDYIADETKKLIGWTAAGAHKRETLKKWLFDGKDGPRPPPEFVATTYCSASEPFVKQKGNIIATARLIKEMGLTKKFKEWRKAQKEASK